MKIISVFFCSLILAALAHGQVIHVPVDQPTIQAGIDSAAFGDTVLVAPGTYHETIDFWGKFITVASLYLTTQDPAYIEQTVIDGSNDRSVVTFRHEETNASVLCGFTITHGESTYGGGIYCVNSRPSLKDLIVIDNKATTYGGGIYISTNTNVIPILENILIFNNEANNAGGGLHIRNAAPKITSVTLSGNIARNGGGMYLIRSKPKLYDVTITNNHAESGGGIYSDEESIPYFDTALLCNMYFNEASIGNEIYSAEPLDIQLDTFTVIYPTQYHVQSLSGVDMEVNHGMITQVDADLYVSPDGDDENNGLTPFNPLKTVKHALSMIRADSLHHHSINLGEGVYSTSETGETFPVGMISHVNIIGESEEDVILDAEDQSGVLYFLNCNDLAVSHFTITGGSESYGNGHGIICSYSSPVLEHLTLTDNSGYGIKCENYSNPALKYSTISYNGNDGLYCMGNSDPDIEDVSIVHNSGNGIYFWGGDPVMENVDIRYNSGMGIKLHATDLVLKKINITHNERTGMEIQSNCSVVFDSTERCNIYLNNSGHGNDIYSYPPVTVVLDTFTVLKPTDFYASPIHNFSFDILNGKIEQVDADLYVSPDGDDQNSGLNEDDPLRTIRYAMSIIMADSLNVNTIHLADGVYSKSTNGEIFPLDIIDYVNLSGVSREGTVLDAEGNTGVIMINDNMENRVSDLSVKGGHAEYEGGGIYCSQANIDLMNINLSGNECYSSGGLVGSNDILHLGNCTISLQGIIITDNNGTGISLYHCDGNITDMEVSENSGTGISCDGGDVNMSEILVDGNQGTGIAFSNGSEASLQNAEISFNKYGGISCDYSNPELVNVNIIFNSKGMMGGSREGGGMYCRFSDPVLRNVRIVHNEAQTGGGMYCISSNPVFDIVNRCNIHSNDALYGKELFSVDPMEVIVDTFSVMNPTSYFVEPVNLFTFDIWHGLLPQIDADLYVSPEGNNSNSGITPEEPLRNIDYAMSVILVDSTNEHTIHLLDGIYSPSSSGEEFPLRVFNYMHLSGESVAGTVLDAEGTGSVLSIFDNTISNFSVTGASESGALKCSGSSARISNLMVSNNGTDGIICSGDSSPMLENLVVEDNLGAGIICKDHSSPIIHNVLINNNEGSGLKCEYYSNASLDSVVISNNEAENGGGIYCHIDNYYSSLNLKAVTIKNNRALYGGGIYIAGSNGPEMDSVDRCNIFLNQAAYGRDLFSEYQQYHVIVDTFTVWNPTVVYAHPLEHFTFDIQHGLLSLVSADLYVSPLGDDANSGLTSDDPLRTIYRANGMILADSLNPRTIYLADGVYSPSTTGEHFPVSLPPYVNLSGQSEENVILDAEGQGSVLGLVDNDSTIISNLSLTGGFSLKGGGLFLEDSRGTFSEIRIYGNTAEKGGGIYCDGSDPRFEDVSIYDNDTPWANYSYGGGVYICQYSRPEFKNVSIHNNSAKNGGGVFFTHSYPYFSNTTISYNTGLYGGGVHFQRYTSVFDSVDRCNIYMNEAIVGRDLYSNEYEVQDIFLDTFTVVNPTSYFAYKLDNFNFDILNGLIPQLEADLYVSPAGSDENSGTIPEEPLKTIKHALSTLLVSEDNPRTIYLGEGRYSPSSTGEFFPVTLADRINLVGVSMEDVTLDAEGTGDVIYIANPTLNTIDNMTIKGGDSTFFNRGIIGGGQLNLRNLNITNNGRGISYSGGGLNIQNTVISNNTGAGIWCDYMDWGSSVLKNVTIADNGGFGLVISEGSIGIINSVIFHNAGSIILDLASASASYSNIEGGWEGEGNIEEDPLFLESGDYPYALSHDSPCVDAGTPDTTGFHLPVNDILGNPRIWNGRIDMGAFEWNNIGVEEFQDSRIPGFQMMCYPNPTRGISHFAFHISQYQWVSLKIFDLHGREMAEVLVEMLPAGEHVVRWDMSGLPAGVYVVELRAEGDGHRAEGVAHRTVGKVVKMD